MKKESKRTKQKKDKYQKPKVIFCKKLTAVASSCPSGYLGFSSCKTLLCITCVSS